MNTIVYTAIALLVLVLLVAFTTGGLGKLFGQVAATGLDEIDAAKSQCSAYCATTKLQISAQGTSAWLTSQYCRKEFSIDITGTGEEALLKCWTDPIFVKCTAKVTTPTRTISLSSDECNEEIYDFTIEAPAVQGP
jgi:hypothetical protein